MKYLQLPCNWFEQANVRNVWLAVNGWSTCCRTVFDATPSAWTALGAQFAEVHCRLRPTNYNYCARDDQHGGISPGAHEYKPNAGKHVHEWKRVAAIAATVPIQPQFQGIRPNEQSVPCTAG